MFSWFSYTSPKRFKLKFYKFNLLFTFATPNVQDLDQFALQKEIVLSTHLIWVGLIDESWTFFETDKRRLMCILLNKQNPKEFLLLKVWCSGIFLCSCCVIQSERLSLPIWLSTSKGPSLKHQNIWVMAIARAKTPQSLPSQVWSTSELIDGLDYLLNDSQAELPDDMAQLEDPEFPSVPCLR